MQSLIDLHRKHHPTKFEYFCEYFESHLSNLRESARSVLEIGVQEGHSVRMWKDYFPNAIIHGVDVPWTSHRFAENRIVEHLGDQSDVEFLSRLIQECDGFDVIVDDGSHFVNHQIISFKTLFPALRPGGVYVIEDLFSSYWRNWGGSYHNRRGLSEQTAIDYLKDLVDALHSEHFKDRVSSDNPPKAVYQLVDKSLKGLS